MNRRHFIASMSALGVLPLARPVFAQPLLQNADIRGSINAVDLGFRPDAFDDQSRIFERILKQASDNNQSVHLPPGIYVVANLKLPPRVRLNGVSGASRLVYGGEGHLLVAEGAEIMELSNLVIDGQNRALGGHTSALVEARLVQNLVIDACDIIGSAKNGVSLEGCAGRVERSRISGASDSGIYSVEAKGMAIRDNEVADCANGGILVHRWQAAEDGTIVSGNRISRISAANGGTGQYGNGINIFRAGNVQVSNNIIADCAFTAIRSNSGSNIQIIGNNCARSGETAIYSEFAFEGAVIANNVVQGAANGISVANFNEGGRLSTVTGNIVRDLSEKGPYPADSPGFGVGIHAEADAAITANVIENAPLYGINLGWGPYLRNVTASGNVIRNCGEGIAVTVADGAGAAVITGNVIEGAKRGASWGINGRRLPRGIWLSRGRRGLRI